MSRAHRRRSQIRFGVLSAVLAVLIAIAATSGDAKPAAQFVLGVSNTLVGDSWREEMICSIKAQALASGKVSKVVVANRNGGPAQQNDDLRTLVAAGANAIILKPSSQTALTDAISYAASRGIKVVAVDQRVTAPQAYAATTDQVAYGRLGAAWLFKALRGKGNVVELRGTAGAPADSDRHAGFLKALKTYPGIKVVKSGYTGGSFSVAGKQMRDILDSGLRVDGVWTSGTDFTVTNAFKAAGKPLVPIVGADTNEFLKQQLTLKGWRAAAVTNPAAIGGVGAAMAIRLLSGASAPKWLKLTPEVWDNGTATGNARIRASFSPSAAPTYSVHLQVKPWTTYTNAQVLGCKGP